MHLVIDPGEVSDGGSLSHSAELVVDGTVAQAHPALVGAEVGHRDATQMGADGRAAHNRGVAGIRNRRLGLLVELGGGGQSVSLIDLRLRETTHEDEITVPGGLEDLTGRELRDVQLLVGVTHVTITGDHLIIDDGDESLDTKDVVTENEALHHVHLSTSNLVVTVLLVPDST